jgi:hypothetical protein
MSDGIRRIHFVYNAKKSKVYQWQVVCGHQLKSHAPFTLSPVMRRRGDTEYCSIQFKNRMMSNEVIKYFKRFSILSIILFGESKMVFSTENCHHYHYKLTFRSCKTPKQDSLQLLHISKLSSHTYQI